MAEKVHRKCPNCELVCHTGELMCRLCNTRLTDDHIVFRKTTPTAPPPVADAAIEQPPPERHGCLSLYLGVVVLGNTLGAVANCLAIGFLGGRLNVGLALFGLLQSTLMVVAALALLRGKQWGFWGFLLLAVFADLVALSNGGYLYVFGSLIGLLLLIGCVFGGGQKRAWNRLT